MHLAAQVPAVLSWSPTQKPPVGQFLLGSHVAEQVPLSPEPSLGMLHGAAAPHWPSVKHSAPPVAQVPLAKIEHCLESQSKSATHGENIL